ncbi:hypothetical protein ACFLZW_01940 [Chloroflexota bacterium]
MPQPENKTNKRRYPAIYEKFIPVALGVIALAIVVLLTITVMVALGNFPGS